MWMQRRWPPPAALLVNCQAVRRELEPWFSCPTFDLPNAVDARRFDPARVAGPRSGSLVVGIAARPAPEKGVDFLLRVVAAVTARLPGARFVWAGSFGWQPHFEEQVRRAGLADALRFVGHVDDVAAFYAACDVVVLTSRRRSIEGSPNALLEAMAMERPVVATAVGGVPEIVRSGVEGFLVDDGDVDGFASALHALLTQPELRRRLGEAGRRRILDRHSLADVVSDLAARLRSLVGQARQDTRGAA
jgi:glycosyltransferase involved in cell wall biosynthesis